MGNFVQTGGKLCKTFPLLGKKKKEWWKFLGQQSVCANTTNIKGGLYIIYTG